MNTASLMTISPQAGATVKSQTPRMVGKPDASSAGTGKETFGDILGKAGEDVKKAMAKSPAEAQGSAVEARDAKINDDMPGPEDTEVLSKDAGKRGGETPQSSRLEQAESGKEAKEQSPDSEEQRIAPAVVMTFTTEGNAQLVQEAATEEKAVQSSHNLQSILPQSSADAQKNKNFLAMLSGQQIKAQDLLKETDQALNNKAPIEQNFSPLNNKGKETPLTAELLFKQMGMAPVKDGEGAKASTMLEAQLGNHRLANQLSHIPVQETSAGKMSVANVNPLLNDAQSEAAVKTVSNQVVNLSDNGRDTTLNAKGMALFQQSEVTMPSRAVGEVMNQAGLQQIGSDIRNTDNMFAGTNIAVENQGPKATIRSQLIDNPVTLMETAGAEVVQAVESEMNLQQVRNLRQEVTLPPLDNNQAAQNPKVAAQVETVVKEPQTVNLRQEVTLPPLDNNQAAQNPKEVAAQAETVVKEPQAVNLRQEVTLPPLDNNQAAQNPKEVAAQVETVVKEPQAVNLRQEVTLPPLDNNQAAKNPKEVAAQAETVVKEPQAVNLRQEVSLPPLDNNQVADNRNALGKVVSEQRVAVPWVASEQGTVTRPADRSKTAGTTPLESQIAALGEKAKENLVLASQGPDNQQMGGRQNPDFRQQLPLTQPTVENVIDEDGQVVQQLAEEAAGDKAAPTKGQDVHNGPVSVFQQDLADSVRGIERQPEVPQNRDVQDNFQVARQIIEQARLIRRGENTEMVIKLHPDHLGELTLKVSVSANGAVNASFHSDNAQVRTIIENSLVQLKQELNNQGLKVDNVDVYAGMNDGQLPQGEGQQAWQQNQSHNGGANHFEGNLSDYGEDADAEAGMQQTEDNAVEGVDYRV